MADLDVIEPIPRLDPIVAIGKDELVEGGLEGAANRPIIALANQIAYMMDRTYSKTDVDDISAQLEEMISAAGKGMLFFETAAQLLATTQGEENRAAQARDTSKIYLWKITSAAGVTPVVWGWVDTGLSDYDKILALLDSKTVVNPAMNQNVNLNDVLYGVQHFNDNSIITTANNFPLAGSPAIVRTFKATASQVKYQVATYPFFNPPRVYERSFTGTWQGWIEKLKRPELEAALLSISQNKNEISKLEQSVFSVGKNKIDKTRIVAGEYVSPSNLKIIAGAPYRRSDFIPVVAGNTYVFSGGSLPNPAIGWFSINDKTATALSVTQTGIVTAPAGANYAVINISHNTNATYDETAQFEIGSSASAYEPFKKIIDFEKLANYQDILLFGEVLENVSFNKIDPSAINFTRRYSTGSKSFVTDSLLIAHTAFIPVVAGEWYTVSGSGLFGNSPSGYQGGYFSKSNLNNAVDNISFVAPVTGAGACFKVPTGLNIDYVVISVKKTAENLLDGIVQLEDGEMATAYQEYAVKSYIREDLLRQAPSAGGTGTGFNDAAWFQYTKAEGGKIFQDKLPKFRKAMLLKNEDVTVVNTGTSLTARTSEHATLHKDAAFRPPMMHSNAFCSVMWDAMKWDGQQYRRYDSGAFTESGAFLTSSNLAEWDDGAYRDGLTRYSSDAAAGVQFTIPANAWAFNFIYRTDSLGCDAKITVAEGAGKVQVFDENTQTWVEANNYTFSQLEAAPVTRSIAVPAVISETTTNYTIASKGNTTYQKRLKMRCRGDDGSFDTLVDAKTVTIARVGGGSRFMYWGVEWSPRQYMITYINAARGSHNTNATGATGLPRFQDNEIWSFKPTLILSELGIHNDGAAAAGVYPVGQWKQLARHYVTNTSYELSMYSRAAHFGLSPEYCFFTASIAWNFGGINDDGSLKYSLQGSSTLGKARMMSALDKYQEATEFLNSVGVPCIDAAKRWTDAGVAIFGDLKAATIGSGKSGATFTNEGSHWNNTGGAIMAKIVASVL